MNPVALVTGGHLRIGKSISMHLAESGYDVAIQYNKSDKSAKDIINLLRRKYNGKFHIFKTNFENEDEYSLLIQKVYEHYGRLDSLICNASCFEYDDFNTSNRNAWDKNMEVNLRAPFVLSQEFAKINHNIDCDFNKDINKDISINRDTDINNINTDKNIIFLLDHWITKPGKTFISYTLSKAALGFLTKILAKLLAPEIRVNAISPGFVMKSKSQTEESFKKMYENTPIKKPIDPKDIARTVEFLISNTSVIGQIVAIDGGSSL